MSNFLILKKNKFLFQVILHEELGLSEILKPNPSLFRWSCIFTVFVKFRMKKFTN